MNIATRWTACGERPVQQIMVLVLVLIRIEIGDLDGAVRVQVPVRVVKLTEDPDHSPSPRQLQSEIL